MKVVLTVDTEPSIAGSFRDATHLPLIHEPVAGEIDGKSEALGFLIQTLLEYQLTSTFFIETVHTRYFSDQPMGRYVEQLLKAKQDVQLHLHPCWLSFDDSRPDVTSPLTDQCSDLELGQLNDLIGEGADQIEKWSGIRPSGMRTGNFSTSMRVFEAMRQSGLTNSSNICVALRPPPEAELRVSGGVHMFAGVRELPVTCFVDTGPIGRGRWRPLQITAASAREQIALLNAAKDRGNRVAVIVTHPFEFLKSRDFRYSSFHRNRLVQSRFRRLCAFLRENSDRFEVVPLAAAAEAIEPAAGSELSGNWLNSILRAVQNGVNDRLYSA